MNKTELVDRIADRSGVSKKDVEASLSGMFDVVADSIRRGEDVTIQGWLKFEQVTRKARMGHNPQTGEKMPIPESKAAKVSALTKLKAAGKGA
jgi:DNA-binding protein HU-beta